MTSSAPNTSVKCLLIRSLNARNGTRYRARILILRTQAKASRTFKAWPRARTATASNTANTDQMLPSLTQPRYPSAALGIEIGSLTAVALQKSGRGQFSLKQAALVDLPPGLIVPSFLSQNISDYAEFAS